MPSSSDKQRRAMHAAASGRGTIGIPPSVAKEFVQADHLRKTNTKKGKYGNETSYYGNKTDGGQHVTHWIEGHSYNPHRMKHPHKKTAVGKGTTSIGGGMGAGAG